MLEPPLPAGAALGNLVGGAAFDLGRATGYPGVPWLLMIGVGVACSVELTLLDRTGMMATRSADERPVPAEPVLAGATANR